jgi:hypothetical protein
MSDPVRLPLEDDDWDNWLHDVFTGICGLPSDMVRPRWQPEPPNRPEIDEDWLAFGVIRKRNDFTPHIEHVDEGDGYDALQEHEINEVLCSFYGPHSEQYASYLRRGFYIDQNRAACRAAAVGLVEIQDIQSAPEYFANRWWPRNDMSVILRREIRLNYPVRTILRAQGIISAQPPGDKRIVPNDFDTGFIPQE